METKIYYRLVDTNIERLHVVIDTENASLPQRMEKTMELIPLFNILTPFWSDSGLQLDTACNCMLYLDLYLPIIQKIEARKEQYVPTFFINSHEKIDSIPFSTIKKFIFAYCDHYEQTRQSLEATDLQYIWEYLWEVVRNSLFPDRLSRFHGTFLFDSYQSAQLFQEREDPQHHRTICKVEINEIRALESYDMTCLNETPTSATFNEVTQIIRNYWEGKQTKTPFSEYLLSGKYTLLPL